MKSIASRIAAAGTRTSGFDYLRIVLACSVIMSKPAPGRIVSTPSRA
jgi:hypothetical protein